MIMQWSYLILCKKEVRSGLPKGLKHNSDAVSIFTSSGMITSELAGQGNEDPTAKLCYMAL